MEVVIKGSFSLESGTGLEDAIECLKEGLEKLREQGDFSATVTIPKQTTFTL